MTPEREAEIRGHAVGGSLLLRETLAELDAVRAERDLAAAELHRLCDAADAHMIHALFVAPVGCSCTPSRRCDLCVERAAAGAP